MKFDENRGNEKIQLLRGEQRLTNSIKVNDEARAKDLLVSKNFSANEVSPKQKIKAGTNTFDHLLKT